MPLEIERKFLVSGTSYRDMSACSSHITQGYLSRVPERTVRVRIIDDNAFVTVKGVNRGCVRSEWEWPIDLADAREMMRLCEPPLVEKVRYRVPHNRLVWEVDEFLGGPLKGHVIAEVELKNADDNIFPLPDFVGEEVTGNLKYYNSTVVPDDAKIAGSGNNQDS